MKKFILLALLALTSCGEKDCANVYEMPDGNYCNSKSLYEEKYYDCVLGKEYFEPATIVRVRVCKNADGTFTHSRW